MITPASARTGPFPMITPASARNWSPGNAAMALHDETPKYKYAARDARASHASGGRGPPAAVPGRARSSASEDVGRLSGDLPNRPLIRVARREEVLPDYEVVVLEHVDHGRDADRIPQDGDRAEGQLRDDVHPHRLVRAPPEGRPPR